MKAAAGVAAAGLLPRRVAAQPRTAAGAATAGSLVASDSAAIAGTTHGKVRGFVHGETFIFRGIPYGAPTSGARRFMAPAKPAPWTGVRSALAWGFASPQIPPEHWDKDEVAFVYEWNPGAQGEDCLRLNVWTPGLDSRKRAVMVWLHGGGFATGSGNEMNVYDGENLARHDVVVVSLNHRVGAVGFLDLSSIGGEKYAASGNVGLARHRRRARVGAGQHRGLRRRSRERDDLRPVRRRREGDRPDGHAAGQGPLSQGHRRERLHATPADARLLGEARRRRAEGGGRRQGPSGSSPGHAVRPLRHGRPSRREEGVPVRRLLAADRLRPPRRVRTPGPRRSTAASCPSIRSGPPRPPHRPACR